MKTTLVLAIVLACAAAACGVKCMVGYSLTYPFGVKSHWARTNCDAGEECLRGDDNLLITAFGFITCK